MANSSRNGRREVGSVTRRPNGRYWARITCGTRVDGRRRTVSKTFDTEREADAWLTAMSIELGRDPNASRGITLTAVWQAYRTDRKGSLARNTLASYANHMDLAWLPALGARDVSSITAAEVQDLLSSMTGSNARHAKAALSAVLSWAVKRDLLAANPLHGHRFEYPAQGGSMDFDEDPFAAIERSRDVWDIDTAMKCFELIRGLPLEPAWLCCVGAGLRVEEALALRRMDVRRVEVGGRPVTQLAVHAARTGADGRKATKTRQSVRIVAMLEPFGARYWEIASGISDKTQVVCPVSAANQNKRWRGYFARPSASKHAPRKEGCNYLGWLASLPYLPLAKMRNTHVTIMAEAGVSDSINALMHGHTEMVERRHYLSPDMTRAVADVSDRLRLVI